MTDKSHTIILLLQKNAFAFFLGAAAANHQRSHETGEDR